MKTDPHMAHPRIGSARWPEPLTASGAAQACPTCLPSPANQLTFRDGPRIGRPLKQGSRFAPCHASIGGCTRGRPAAFPPRTKAITALIGHRRAGSPGLRPLAPLPSASAPNQRTFADQRGCVRPFLPFSPSPKPRLRAERIGGVTSFDLSSGVPGNEFRDSLKYTTRPAGFPTCGVIFLRQMTNRIALFLRKSAGRKKHGFSAALRVSGTRREGNRLRLISETSSDLFNLIK
jgi:hypothetical protein